MWLAYQHKLGVVGEGCSDIDIPTGSDGGTIQHSRGILRSQGLAVHHGGQAGVGREHHIVSKARHIQAHNKGEPAGRTIKLFACCRSASFRLVRCVLQQCSMATLTDTAP